MHSVPNHNFADWAALNSSWQFSVKYSKNVLSEPGQLDKNQSCWYHSTVYFFPSLFGISELT